MVDKGAATPKPCFSPVEMRTRTAAGCSNPAQAVPKDNGYPLVGDFKAVNQQSEPVAAPPMLLEEQASAFAGAALFGTVDLNQGY